MKKILLTLITVMIGAMSMHAQDDVYGKQQQLNEQKAQVELKQKLNRQEQKRLQQQIDSIQHEPCATRCSRLRQTAWCSSMDNAPTSHRRPTLWP